MGNGLSWSELHFADFVPEKNMVRVIFFPGMKCILDTLVPDLTIMKKGGFSWSVIYFKDFGT